MTLSLEDSRKRGESPVALRIDSQNTIRLAERWIDVAERLVVHADFGTPDEALGLIADAEAMGVDVEERTLGKRPGRTVRERLAELVS